MTGILRENACLRQSLWSVKAEIGRKVMTVKHAIKYFSFWDVPRTFAFERGSKVYVLTSEFDDDLDEYSDNYEVLVVSGIRDLSSVSDWKSIERLPKTRVGSILVSSVRFEGSRPKYVDDSFNQFKMPAEWYVRAVNCARQCRAVLAVVPARETSTDLPERRRVRC